MTTNDSQIQTATFQTVLVGPAFELVRHSPLLKEKKLVGKGSFSVLFEGETDRSIYRLSMDNATHEFALRAKQTGLKGVVRSLNDYGAVAIYQGNGSDPDYLWLAHVERLSPLTGFAAKHRSIARLLAHLTGEEDGLLLTEVDEREAVLEALPTAMADADSELVVHALAILLPEYLSRADFDLTISNFMVRPATGEIVLSDPVHGVSKVSAAFHNRLLEESLIIEELPSGATSR